MTKISNYLLSKKQGHSFVVLVNLRNDVAVECDGKAYSVRDSTLLDEPVIHPGLSKEELEVGIYYVSHVVHQLGQAFGLGTCIIYVQAPRSPKF